MTETTITLTQAYTLARTLMDEHGLDNWGINWDRARNRWGQCRYGTRTLSFSALLTPKRTEADFRNTVLHEIAHALTPGAKHGPAWRRKFLAIGGDGKRCSEGPTLPKRWLGVHDSPRCSRTWTRDRRPTGAVCPSCLIVIRWIPNPEA